jgi:hypothetical protein
VKIKTVPLGINRPLYEDIMEITMSRFEARMQKDLDRMQRMFDEVEKLERVHKQLEEMAKMERVRRTFEALQRLADTVCIKLPHNLNHFAHRVQNAAGGKGKTSAKRKSSSSGSSSGGGSSGDGGDGGGDGDGPAHTPSKSKKPRSKPRSTSLQHPPSLSPGAIENTSQPYPSSSSPPGQSLLVALVVIYSTIIALLFVLDKDKTALAFASLMVKAIRDLMRCVIKPPK